MKNNWKDEFEDFWQSDYCTKDSIKKFISNLLSEQKKELLLEIRTYIGDLDYQDLHTKSVNEWVDEFIKSKGVIL